MKKTFLFLFIIVLALPPAAQCQLDKGAWFGSFTANLGYNNDKLNETGGMTMQINTMNIMVIDNIGYFVARHLAIGPGITFNYTGNQVKSDTAGGSIKTNNTLYSIDFSPFIRYYFATTGKVSYFAQVNGTIGYGQDIQKFANTKFTVNTTTYGGGIGAGLVYLFLDNVGLEALVAYNVTGNSIKNKESIVKTFDYTSLHNSVSLGLGFSVYF